MLHLYFFKEAENCSPTELEALVPKIMEKMSGDALRTHFKG